MSTTPGRKRRRTITSFVAAYGEGPWQCSVCDKQVATIGQGSHDGNVHHLDNDVANDNADNLVMAHTACHLRYYHPVSTEMRVRISVKLKGRPSPTRGMTFSDEVNAKKSRPGDTNPFYGKTHDEETLAKMRQPRRRQACDGCGRLYAMNWLTRHQCVL